MKYFLRRIPLNGFSLLEIDENQFLFLEKSQSCLVAALTIEENYELLLSNYLELEKDSLSITCDAMIRTNQRYSDFFGIRLQFNRRLVNLLTATKLYIDHISQHVSSCISSEIDESPDIPKIFSRHYDEHFEYRLMEALRNYVQHRGLAVHSTSMGGKWTTPDKLNGHMEYQTAIYVHKDKVLKDSKFKKAVPREMPDKVELINAVRVYMESLSHIHNEIRNIIRDDVLCAREAIDSTVCKFDSEEGKRPIGVEVVSVHDDNERPAKNSFYLLLEWDNIRLELEKSNKPLTNLHKRFVSGKAYNN